MSKPAPHTCTRTGSRAPWRIPSSTSPRRSHRGTGGDLAELFPIWEVRNGSRAAELNMPAVVYVETRGGTGIGGSDDHAGVDIGRTFTEVPAAVRRRKSFSQHMRAGEAEAPAANRAAPPSGPTRRWRSRPGRSARTGAAPGGGGPDPAAVLKMAERVIGEGSAREGKVAADIGPDDARCLLEAWLAGVGLDLRGRELIAHLQSRRTSPTPTSTAAPAGATTAACAARSTAGSAAVAARRLPRRRQRPLRGARAGRPLRALDRLPRRREGEALAPRRRAPAGGADRRRDRLDARRHPHDRADPRARRARLRDRRDRHRSRRRPPPARRRRAGDPLLRGDAARRSRPARPGRGAGRGHLRPGPRHRPRPGRDRGDAARAG